MKCYQSFISSRVIVATFATLPAASAVAIGTQYLASDIGSGGTIFVSNGTIWRPLNGQAIIGQSGASVSKTGDTNENGCATITIPANMLTANGRLEVWTLWTYTNSINNKTLRVRFGATAGSAYTTGTQYLSVANTTTVTAQYITTIQNANATNSQVAMSNSGGVAGTSGAALTTSSVDTTASSTVYVSAQLASSGETITLSAYQVKLVIP